MIKGSGKSIDCFFFISCTIPEINFKNFWKTQKNRFTQNLIFYWIFASSTCKPSNWQLYRKRQLLSHVSFEQLQLELHYRRKLCARCLWAVLKITADFEPRYLSEKRDRAFLKIQLESLWNFTSSELNVIDNNMWLVITCYSS